MVRPVLRLVVAALVLFGLPAIWAGGQAWLVYTGQPNPSADYMDAFRALAGAEADRSGDAYALYAAAVEDGRTIFESVQNEVRGRGRPPREAHDDGWPDFDRVIHGAVPEKDIARELDTLRRLEAAGIFDRLDRLAGSGPGLASEAELFASHRDRMHGLAHVRSLAKACAARLRLGVLEDDPERIVASYRQGRALACTSSYEPAMTSYLVGLAVDALMGHQLEYALLEMHADEATARALLAALDETAPAPPSLAIEAERLLYRDLVQRCFTDDGEGDGYVLPWILATEMRGFTGSVGGPGPVRRGLGLALRARFEWATRRETLASADEWTDAWLREAALPAAERGRFDFESLRRKIRTRDPAIHLLSTPLDKVLFNDLLSRRRAADLRLMIALELHRSRHGAYPTALEELVPEVLPAVPANPCDDGPFLYALPPDGRYVLYTAGVDGVDDAGRFHEIQPILGLMPDGRGFDVLCNRTRPPE